MHHYPRLKELRVDKDLNQKDVAEWIDIDQQQYSKYELGKREIPLHKLIILSQKYGTSLDYMVGLTDDPKPPVRNNSN